jgi:hypothetical protein
LTRDSAACFANFFGAISQAMLVDLVQLRGGTNSAVHTFRVDERLLAMSIDEWWPKLAPSTRDCLIENNGDAVPPEIVAEIAAVGGSAKPEDWWVGQIGPAGFFISDEAIDWIEEMANDEPPTTL